MTTERKTNANPKEKLIDAIIDFTSKHHAAPKTAILPRELAWDFCKFGRDELGPLADELFLKGPTALNGKSLFGVQIIVPSLEADVNEITFDSPAQNKPTK
jgi:hypothetical protein